MKATRFFTVVLVLTVILLSACAAPSAPPASPGNGEGGKPLFSEVVFTGVIEGMDGDQWVINGQRVKVDASVLKEGPFVIGDTVKVEARVAEDGSVTAQRVESPSAADLAEISTSTPAASSNQLPLVFDDSGTEGFGTVESITDTSITIGGQTFTFAPGAEIKGVITAGTVVKVHFVANADGSLSVREVELADPAQVGGGNGNDDNSNTNTNDDNSNDDNSNDGNSNDDNGNDDDGNDDNSDDDDEDDNSDDSNDNG